MHKMKQVIIMTKSCQNHWVAYYAQVLILSLLNPRESRDVIKTWKAYQERESRFFLKDSESTTVAAQYDCIL